MWLSGWPVGMVPTIFSVLGSMMVMVLSSSVVT